MSSTPRKWKFRIRHLLEAIAECQRFTAGMTAEQFAADARTLKAVVCNLMIMSEAARQIPSDIEAANPEVPWAAICGMRNHIVHSYDVIDAGIVWNIVQDRLQPLVAVLERIEREAVE
jgi:uncharacterized protein with HEPN domain